LTNGSRSSLIGNAVPQGSNCYVSYFVRVPVAKRDAKFH
jgi:hypothetical protein